MRKPRQTTLNRSLLAPGLGIIVLASWCVAQERATEAPQAGDARPDAARLADSALQDAAAEDLEYRNVALRGKVVWLADVLKQEFAISTVPEVSQNTLALLSTDGTVLPIVENERGRAFRKDQRLRDVDVELLVRQHEQHPFLQILRVYQIEDGKKYEVDYWCDVCAIIMYETGPCSCCQDNNRLRKRLVTEERE